MNTDAKIDHIYKSINEQNVQLAKFITHQEQHRKEIDANTAKIDKLTSFKDSLWGIVISVPVIISAIGLLIHIYFGK